MSGETESNPIKARIKRLELEKERDIYKMKCAFLLEEMKRCKRIANLLRIELDNKIDENKKLIEQTIILNDKICQLNEQNELNNLKKVSNSQSSESIDSEILHPLGTIDICDATKKGSLDAIKYWISQSNFSDTQKNTPLHYAAEKGFLHILEFFAKNKRDFKNMLEFKNNIGETPLLRAVKTNQFLDIIKILVENGANIEIEDNSKNRPLYWACHYENESVAGYLISRGANVEVKTSNADTPLIIAASKCNFPIIKLLVQKGANINVQGINGETALHWGYKSKKETIIKYLIEKGANENILNFNGKLPKDFQNV